MKTPSAVWQLDTRRLGRRVLVFDELDSTNNFATDLANDPANDGVVVLSGRQTAGRGQHGHIWQSPPGMSVLLSVLCFPPPLLRRAAVLTAWAAVSVCETVFKATGIQANIKWPNDVLVEGRKVCGILAEQAKGTVVGIGLNINQSAENFAAAGLPEATSLHMLTSRSFDCNDVARLLIRQLDEEYNRLLAGDWKTLESNWRKRIDLIGRNVAAECADGTIHGQLLEISFDGILLNVGGGEVRLLAPELIWHLKPE